MANCSKSVPFAMRCKSRWQDLPLSFYHTPTVNASSFWQYLSNRRHFFTLQWNFFSVMRFLEAVQIVQKVRILRWRNLPSLRMSFSANAAVLQAASAGGRSKRAERNRSARKRRLLANICEGQSVPIPKGGEASGYVAAAHYFSLHDKYRVSQSAVITCLGRTMQCDANGSPAVFKWG